MPELPKPVVLIVDDDPGGRPADRAVRPRSGLRRHRAPWRIAASPNSPHLKPDVALVDLRTPEVGGLDLLSRDTRGPSDVPRDPDDCAFDGGLGD